ncbi:MAG: hypothetical protein GEU81_12970 [Nitriliruptorales bacterium]|nr:hypothetical protein [Nitriliruptorales bacterium]
MTHLTTVAAREQLSEALEDFDAALPGVSRARDVLEHFDAYTRGVGDLQQPNVGRRGRAPDERLARQYRIDFDHIDDDVGWPRLHIGPYPIDLTEAGRAASRLVDEIWAAAKTDEGEPVSRQALAAFLE